MTELGMEISNNCSRRIFNYLSYDVASGSEITPCNKSVNH